MLAIINNRIHFLHMFYKVVSRTIRAERTASSHNTLTAVCILCSSLISCCFHGLKTSQIFIQRKPNIKSNNCLLTLGLGYVEIFFERFDLYLAFVGVNVVTFFRFRIPKFYIQPIRGLSRVSRLGVLRVPLHQTEQDNQEISSAETKWQLTMRSLSQTSNCHRVSVCV